ncbi:MAG: RNA 2',3'-cyclic phosphodiesterase [Euryhalocaulis sp.]|uniref:RNA 2',3'-cyclic phosphodiesterase n=1 Tax=Euryhalocaulis sp. TaxID=2744307 RepID=UPI00183AC1E3|nr:RNA 2',3'-cyclic phosphodiesterase [Euryhalocaulis sp.]MBA4801008.1 RNA 2',3'-cyclic phosphodiesterase [Euryhalocaulis sp.]
MTLRLFTAIEIPEEAADRLVPLQKGVGGAKWRPRENFHITLSFFGELEEPDAAELDANLAQIDQPPFEVTLKGAGCFGNKDPHALWIGVEENASLTRLAAACNKAARQSGLAPDKRPFTPHVTMAYLNGAEIKRVISFVQRLTLFELPSFPVDRFELWSSRPAKYGANHYISEAEYPLRG